jgi:hypothetical protein
LISNFSRQLVEIAKGHHRLTIAGAEKLTGANRNTIKLHLRRLVEQCYLTKHGTGRGTWYNPA